MHLFEVQTICVSEDKNDSYFVGSSAQLFLYAIFGRKQWSIRIGSCFIANVRSFQLRRHLKKIVYIYTFIITLDGCHAYLYGLCRAARTLKQK